MVKNPSVWSDEAFQVTESNHASDKIKFHEVYSFCKGKNAREGNGAPLQYSCMENPYRERSLVGCSSWGHKVSYMTEWLTHTHTHTHTHTWTIEVQHGFKWIEKSLLCWEEILLCSFYVQVYLCLEWIQFLLCIFQVHTWKQQPGPLLSFSSEDLLYV